jgi:hypothetical protein
MFSGASHIRCLLILPLHRSRRISHVAAPSNFDRFRHIEFRFFLAIISSAKIEFRTNGSGIVVENVRSTNRKLRFLLVTRYPHRG